MNKYFHCGETVSGYEIPVLNEREVRASAGILFFFAMIAFFNAFLLGNLYGIKLFVIIFLIDFTIRVFVNPMYSPSMILGRFAVQNQKPEYVGAVQKRFAWSMGLILAIVMFVSIVIFNTIGTVNLLICLVCLLLMFLETAFGICVGCKMYALFFRTKAQLCPGGVCEVGQTKTPIQQINLTHIIALILIGIPFILLTQSNILNQRDIQRTGFLAERQQKNICASTPEWVTYYGYEQDYKTYFECN